MNTENVKAKVRALLNLSNNDNVNESAAAYKAAQKLLSKHRLSMADIDESYVCESVHKDGVPLYRGVRAVTWKGRLARGIAQANSCDAFWDSVFINGKWHKQIIVVGRKSDIDIVRDLYNRISNQILSMCKAHMLTSGEGKTFANNFKNGAVQTVVLRLKAASTEVEQECTSSKALVLIDKTKQDVESLMKSLGLKARLVPKPRSYHGLSQGMNAGSKISLARAEISQKKNSQKARLLNEKNKSAQVN